MEKEHRIEFNDLPKEASTCTAILRYILGERLQARELEEEAKRIKDEVSGLFKNLAEQFGFTTIESNIGSMYLQKTGGRSTFSQIKAKDALLKAGIDSDTVADAFKVATSKSEPSVSVAFRLPQEKSKK